MNLLFIYPEQYAIVSLPPQAAMPQPPATGFFTCMRDKNEVTLVLPEPAAPADALSVAGGYRVIMLDTTFAFDVIGVLAACSKALAAAGIPIMAYSSYATDTFLIQDRHFTEAVAILESLRFGVQS